MFNILNTLNDNITILNGNLNSSARVVEEDGKEKDEDRMEEDNTIEKRKTNNSSMKDNDIISTEDF